MTGRCRIGSSLLIRARGIRHHENPLCLLQIQSSGARLGRKRHRDAGRPLSVCAEQRGLTGFFFFFQESDLSAAQGAPRCVRRGAHRGCGDRAACWVRGKVGEKQKKGNLGARGWKREWGPRQTGALTERARTWQPRDEVCLGKGVSGTQGAPEAGRLVAKRGVTTRQEILVTAKGTRHPSLLGNFENARFWFSLRWDRRPRLPGRPQLLLVPRGPGPSGRALHSLSSSAPCGPGNSPGFWQRPHWHQDRPAGCLECRRPAWSRRSRCSSPC